MSDFVLKPIQRVRIWNIKFTICWNLHQNFSKRVRFRIEDITTCQFSKKNAFIKSIFEPFYSEKMTQFSNFCAFSNWKILKQNSYTTSDFEIKNSQSVRFRIKQVLQRVMFWRKINLHVRFVIKNFPDNQILIWWCLVLYFKTSTQAFCTILLLCFGRGFSLRFSE